MILKARVKQTTRSTSPKPTQVDMFSAPARHLFSSLIPGLVILFATACGTSDPTSPNQTAPPPVSATDMSAVDMAQGGEPDASPALDMPPQPVDMTASEPDANPAEDMRVTTPDAEADLELNPPDAALDQGDMPTVEDASSDLTESEMGQMADMTMEADADIPSDMPADMPADMPQGLDLSSRAQGDCMRSSDCGSATLSCDVSAVGGVCSGDCTACGSIPGSGTYTCVQAACVPDCSTDDECAPGRFCNTRRGLCQVLRCTAGVCPVPWFGCSAPGGICVRQSCAMGQSCPAQTQCVSGTCIEDHSVR